MAPINFGTVTVGTQPEAQGVVVTNTSTTTPVTVTEVYLVEDEYAESFTIAMLTPADGTISVPAGETVTVAAIRPVASLAVGPHTATIAVNCAEDQTFTSKFSFIVAPAYGYGDSDDDDDDPVNYTLTFQTGGGSPPSTPSPGTRGPRSV